MAIPTQCYACQEVRPYSDMKPVFLRCSGSRANPATLKAQGLLPTVYLCPSCF